MKTWNGFCDRWLFFAGDVSDAWCKEFADQDWAAVTLPHTWNADDMAPGRPSEEAYIGPAWYRKHFSYTPGSDERVYLQFEAVANFSEVWVDGKFVGGRDGGFLGYELDVTEALDAREDHVVAVRADNSPRTASVPPDPIDWERYGGIYRPVWLLIKHPASFSYRGIAISTPHVSHDSATLHVTAEIVDKGHCSQELFVVHRLYDPSGNEVDEVSSSVQTARGGTVKVDTTFPEITNPALWSPEMPNMYRIESLLCQGDTILDKEESPCGFRWFNFDPDHGFSLNDVPMKLEGCDVHQEFPGLGIACSERFHWNDVKQMRDAGMNFVRGSHYPRNDRFLRACDELGVMVMEEQPFWHGSLRTGHGEELVTNAQRLMREMVEHHGNHPSIICWSTVNEIVLTPVKGEPHPDPEIRRKQHRLSEEEWPFVNRCIEAMNAALHRADPRRPTCVVIGGHWKDNEEAGFSYAADMVGYNGGAFNKVLEDGRTVYDVCKEKDPGRISLMTEGILNAGKPPRRGDWKGELNFWEVCAEHWSRIYARDWFCGGAMWVFADYSAKGSYRNMGCVDFRRLPKETYYFFQSQWQSEPMVHICGHWSRDATLPEPRRVVVFTNCEEVELILNEKTVAKAKPDFETWPYLPHPPVEFELPLEPGTLQARGRSSEGTEVWDKRVTEDSPARINLTAEPENILADGQNISFVTLEVCDAANNRCYTYFGTVSVEVTGQAYLAGSPELEVRGGLTRFAVRAANQGGHAVIIARCPDLSEDGKMNLEVEEPT